MNNKDFDKWLKSKESLIGDYNLNDRYIYLKGLLLSAFTAGWKISQGELAQELEDETSIRVLIPILKEIEGDSLSDRVAIRIITSLFYKSKEPIDTIGKLKALSKREFLNIKDIGIKSYNHMRIALDVYDEMERKKREEKDLCLLQ